jgi:hypothetical protein
VWPVSASRTLISNPRCRAENEGTHTLSNTLSAQIVNCAELLRYPDGRELRIMKGVICPQCGAPIHAFDARRFDNGTMFIICRAGHDIFSLGASR